MLTSLVLFGLLAQQDPAPGPASPGLQQVDDCQPCQVTVAPNTPPVEAYFLIVKSPEGRLVRRIGLQREAKPLQELTVPDMVPLADGEKFVFGGMDLNFDGNSDLALVVESGGANASAEYWLFDAATQTFRSLGRYGMFTVDAGAKRLKTYDRGGSGGTTFTAREYEFRGPQLTLMREEIQRPTRRPGYLQHTIRERRASGMAIVKQETIPMPRP